MKPESAETREALRIAEVVSRVNVGSNARARLQREIAAAVLEARAKGMYEVCFTPPFQDGAELTIRRLRAEAKALGENTHA